MINPTPPYKIIFKSTQLMNMGKRYYFMAYNFKIWWVGAYRGMGGY